MVTLDELDYGGEIHNLVCATCGGTLVWRGGETVIEGGESLTFIRHDARLWCDWCHKYPTRFDYVEGVEEIE